MSGDWFVNPDDCDISGCKKPAAAIFAKPVGSEDLFLGFCNYHFFEIKKILNDRGWIVAATNGTLVRVRKG